MVAAASVALRRGRPAHARAAPPRTARARLRRLQPRHPRDARPGPRGTGPRRAGGRPRAGHYLRPGPERVTPDGRSAPDPAAAGPGDPGETHIPVPGAADVPGPAETEASLLARSRAGDVAAFERLSGAYADRLFMLLVRLLGDRDEAGDVAQEVMLRAWRGIASFRGQSSYFTWLYRIAVNEANRALEKRARRPASVPIGAGELDLPAPAALDPSRQAENRELRRALGQALAGL